jgi:hypothetical protein
MMACTLVHGDEGPAIAELIEKLAKVEVAFTVAASDEPEAGLVAQRDALQDQIWRPVQTVARRDPSPVTTALITALNEMFDSALAQRFALQSRVPPTVSWMLFWGAVLAIGAMGYQFGLAGDRYPVLVLLLHPALAWRRSAGDRDAACRASHERPVLPWQNPTVADICLVTQVTPAMTFNLLLEPYPRVMRVYDTCMAIPAFADAHPSKQPDAE